MSAVNSRRLCLLLVLCLLASGCGQTPQLSSEEGLSAADALWTSITAKDTGLLEASAGKIEKLHAAADLSDEAFGYLADVIATARAGKWTEARTALKTFVRGQRPAARRT
jgi:hypothetical protein